MESDERPLTDEERNAIRAYLARAEVRMSTTHRIATAFLSGAGLLLLIPFFFRDVMEQILFVILSEVGLLISEPKLATIALTLVLCVTIGYVLALSLIIPLYALYLLLKDLVHFYFTIYAPGFSDGVLNPIFALGGMMFPLDEAEHVKQEAMRYQYSQNNSNFTLPFSEGRRSLYFEDLINVTNGDIIPQTRRDISGVLSPDSDIKKATHLNVAFGITGGFDRYLIEEVGIMEMALTRNILYLRRILLRYVKTLLLFIWTTLIAFIALPFLQHPFVPKWLVLSVAYFLWSLAVMRIVHLPIQWMYRHRYSASEPQPVDIQLAFLEKQIRPYCRFAIAVSICSVVCAVLILII